MPNLKKFLSNSKSPVTLAALEAISKLVTDDGPKSNMVAEFEYECKRSNNPKKVGFSPFKDRRFTTLGYTAGCIIHHINEFNSMFANSKRNNELIKACKLYLSIPFIKEALCSLSIFTESIVLPFLGEFIFETFFKI